MESNTIYVDKTKILYELLQDPDGAFIINGPQRSGKTLLLSTIKSIFTKSINWWEKYGSNLWITKEHSEFFKKNPYPILRFNFSRRKSAQEFQDTIMQSLNHYITKYDLSYPKIPTNETFNKVIQRHLLGVIDCFTKNFHNKKPIVLIDECDQPLLIIMQNDKINDNTKKETMENLLENYKDFYGELKRLLDEDLRSIIICGHSMITQTSIYSDK